ncbi:hypothetical protein [uncultured Erythrobacter sp.]|uniref:hypothetical protein n=1 Tax=uncultured Erythrobacter sp. TaxID=263913 RepID=UPI002617D91C|nr:hypothetical protein [uncultured Erythrobacter sp.]
MVYELIIHRRKFWMDEDNPIDLNTWIELCRSDPDLTIEEVVMAQNPKTGEQIRIEGDGTAFWEGPSKGGERDNTCFSWDRGAIRFGGGHELAILAKACKIAEALGARVQGVEGEFYRADGSHYYD